MASPNMKYAKSHEWIQLEGDTGVVTQTRVASGPKGLVSTDAPQE